MSQLGDNIIGKSSLDPFFLVSNADEVSIDAPNNRKGDALRTWVRSLSGFQKEALVRSAKTGNTWRLVSDEGPCFDFSSFVVARATKTAGGMGHLLIKFVIPDSFE